MTERRVTTLNAMRQELATSKTMVDHLKAEELFENLFSREAYNQANVNDEKQPKQTNQTKQTQQTNEEPSQATILGDDEQQHLETLDNLMFFTKLITTYISHAEYFHFNIVFFVI